MSKKQFSQEQKLKILESAEKLGARPVADIAGIHYTTVYEWRNQLKARGICGQPLIIIIRKYETRTRYR